jgi:hypothetical protein
LLLAKTKTPKKSITTFQIVFVEKNSYRNLAFSDRKTKGKTRQTSILLRSKNTPSSI